MRKNEQQAGTSVSLPVALVKQILSSYAQHRRKARSVLQGDVPDLNLSGFNLLNLPDVHTGSFGELPLREPGGLPQF